MIPVLKILTPSETEQIIQEAIALLDNPGLKIDHATGLNLLEEAGARIDQAANRASFSPDLVESCLEYCPERFSLYDLQGKEAVRYGTNQTHFTPGSSALNVLDSHSQEIHPAATSDLVRFIQLVEMLPALDAQSTAMVCGDVPEPIQDLYRLYLALCFQNKPIVTGVFHYSSWKVMRRLLEIALGSSQLLEDKPAAIFDICPTSPLSWSFTSFQNLIDNARSGIPVQIISMPMAGATSPVTLSGTLVQHTAECLSGVVIAQLARPGSSVVWGGSAAVFDMKYNLASLAAPGTWLLACAYAQIGRTLGLPTQGYLGLSDAKLVDAQAGMESAAGALLGLLADFSMISGAGMLAHENCQSPEKLLLDAEMIAQLKHFSRGIQFRDDPYGMDLIRAVGHEGDFLSLDHTYRWFKTEAYYPSPLIDRQQTGEWQKQGARDAWQRARERVIQLQSQYPGPSLDGQTRRELRRVTERAAQQAGMDQLPSLQA